MSSDPKALALSVLLQRTPLFSQVTVDGFQALAQILRERQLRWGEVLCQPGDPGDSMIIVRQGRLAVQHERQPGETVLENVGPGRYLCEMSCIEPAPREESMVADEDSVVLELSQEGLQVLQQKAPQAAVAVVSGIIARVTKRLRETDQRIEQMLKGPLRATPSLVLPRAVPAMVAAQPTPYKGPLDLQKVQLSRGLNEADLELLQSVAPPLRYPDGALLCIEGAPGSSCFIVAQGQVDVLRRVGQPDRVLATMGPGSLLGHLALIDGTRRSASLRARGEAIVLPLQREDFARLLKAYSPLAIRFQEQVAIAGIRQLRLAASRLATALQAATRPADADEQSEQLESLRAALREWYTPPQAG